MSDEAIEIKGRGVPEVVLDAIYTALYDANERLGCGTTNIKRCLNYLEQQQGYSPPEGYLVRSPEK